MHLLKRILYWEAAAWGAAGVLLAVAPRFVLGTLMHQLQLTDYAWIRFAGIQAVGLAMLMVLVGQSVQDRWWWAWAFAVVTAAMATVSALNATVSVPSHTSPTPWWVLTLALLAMVGVLLLAVGRAGIESPPDIPPE
jgi:hypothetical protein